MQQIEKCSLCGSTSLEILRPEKDKRHYYLCNDCKLIFADPKYFLSLENEKNRYAKHKNGPEHLPFLQKVIDPALKYLNVSMKGLDYGCGAKPAISGFLKNKGIDCENYDPLYGINYTGTGFDFIFSTEAVEHFHYPGKEWETISKLLEPKGFAMIMTERWDSLDSFKTWYYKMDETHVCFYSLQTFFSIGKKFGLSVKEYDNNRVMILQKN